MKLITQLILLLGYLTYIISAADPTLDELKAGCRVAGGEVSVCPGCPICWIQKSGKWDCYDVEANTQKCPFNGRDVTDLLSQLDGNSGNNNNDGQKKKYRSTKTIMVTETAYWLDGSSLSSRSSQFGWATILISCIVVFL